MAVSLRRYTPLRAPAQCLVPLGAMLLLIACTTAAADVPAAAHGSPPVRASPPAPRPTPPPFHPSGDPMYDMMQLMGRCMDVLTATDKRFEQASTHTVEAIGGFGDRIVYTERLINDMGKQIGWMADKIVETEHICANLTSDCFCDAPASMRMEEDDAAAVRVVVENTAENTVAHTAENTVAHTVENTVARGFGPWDAMIDMMLHSLDLFDQMSYNVTNMLEFEVDAIGTMGDRIVRTECLIMDMGKQIGVMADRIVETEKMMANVSRSCCGAHARTRHSVASVSAAALMRPRGMGSMGRAGPGPECANYSRRSVDTPQPELHVELLRAMVQRGGGGGSGGGAHAVRGNLWVDMVRKLVDPMMDAMAHMMMTIASGIQAGTNEIGVLAEDIVNTEHLINAMGLEIGHMADCIVETERLGLHMAEEFCHMGSSGSGSKAARGGVCPPIKPVHPVHPKRVRDGAWEARMETARTEFDEAFARATAAAAEWNTALRLRAANGGGMGVRGFDPARDFVEMTRLCKQFMGMIEVMGRSVGQEMGVVMRAIRGFADRIGTTMGLMDDMAGQINNMAGRIVKTMQLLSALEGTCAN